MSAGLPPPTAATRQGADAAARAFGFQQAPGHLIRRAHQISVAVFAEEVAAHAVTPVQFAVLNTLLAQPGIDQITLAQRVAFDAATIGSVIARLERRGWLCRQAAQDDRRRKRLWLKEAGAAVAMRPAVELAQRILGPLDATEQQQLMALLEKLVTHRPRGLAT